MTDTSDLDPDSGRDRVMDQDYGVKTPTVRQKLQARQRKQISVSRLASFTLEAGYDALNDYACGSLTAMQQWLDQPTVWKALHVKGPNKAIDSGMTYERTAQDLQPLYKSLVLKYKILIYSGDTDACVPFVGTETWTRNLGYPVIKDWHQWLAKPDKTHSVHKAGYAVTFSNNFQFITINGAGHLVPTHQPGYALNMFKIFLNGGTF